MKKTYNIHNQFLSAISITNLQYNYNYENVIAKEL